MRFFQYILLFCLLFLTFYIPSGDAQRDSSKLKLFEPASSFHAPRFWGMTSGITASYTATVIWLDRSWYANYPRSNFRFFNDWPGWRQMDKMGHFFTTYFESKWVYGFYRWTGIPNKKAAWIGAGSGMLFQTTLEVLDGFSTEWGFSWWDMAFNSFGSGLFLSQQLLWDEQRIRLKMSTHRPKYPTSILYSIDGTATSSLKNRANNLYGKTFAELFFKEYNGQTMWMSINIASFLKARPKWLPPWINVAVGYGIENVYGAESNQWEENGVLFAAPAEYPRYSQYFLSLDIDFERIPVKRKGWKVLFGFLNIFKVPFPALEMNTLGQVKFRPFYF